MLSGGDPESGVRLLRALGSAEGQAQLSVRPGQHRNPARTRRAPLERCASGLVSAAIGRRTSFATRSCHWCRRSWTTLSRLQILRVTSTLARLRDTATRSARPSHTQSKHGTRCLAMSPTFLIWPTPTSPIASRLGQTPATFFGDDQGRARVLGTQGQHRS